MYLKRYVSKTPELIDTWQERQTKNLTEFDTIARVWSLKKKVVCRNPFTENKQTIECDTATQLHEYIHRNRNIANKTGKNTMAEALLGEHLRGKQKKGKTARPCKTHTDTNSDSEIKKE